MLDRLGTYEETLAFLIHAVPFDNNEAERDAYDEDPPEDKRMLPDVGMVKQVCTNPKHHSDGQKAGELYLRNPAGYFLQSGGCRKTPLQHLNGYEFPHIYAVATSPRACTMRIRHWCKLVEESGLVPLCRFARGLLCDLPTITAFFKNPNTSGEIASFNNQISRLIHRACGMTDLCHLYLKMGAQSIKQT